jgi:hypothetical protein
VGDAGTLYIKLLYIRELHPQCTPDTIPRATTAQRKFIGSCQAECGSHGSAVAPRRAGIEAGAGEMLVQLVQLVQDAGMLLITAAVGVADSLTRTIRNLHLKPFHAPTLSLS